MWTAFLLMPCLVLQLLRTVNVQPEVGAHAAVMYKLPYQTVTQAVAPSEIQTAYASCHERRLPVAQFGRLVLHPDLCAFGLKTQTAVRYSIPYR